MTNRFHGNGFSKDPIDGDEAAKHRHMFKDLSEDWVEIDGAVAVVKAFAIISKIAKVGGPIALMAAGGGALAKSQGWI